MPRIARDCLETSFFHVIVQGIKREYIFKRDEYKEKYIYLLNKYKTKYNIEIIAYCIMDNHAHLLIYSDKIDNLSSYMHKLNGIFAQHYNKIEKRVGYVFRNRYVSESIDNKYYLIRCIDYIHKNPVKAKIVDKCEEYKFSTYKQYMKNTGIAINKKNMDILGKCNYKKIFEELDNQEYFYDVDIDRKEFLENLICKFCKEKNKSIDEIIEDTELLKELIKELKNKYKITYVEMMERLKITKGRINSLKK